MSDRTDISTAQSCLQLYLSRSKQRAQNREVLRTQIMASQAGTRGLSWHLNSTSHGQMKLSDMRFLDLVIFCLVAEGSTPFLWELLNISHPNLGSKVSSENRSLDLSSSQVRILVLRQLLKAQTYWSTGKNVFNEPLETFLTARLNPMLGEQINSPYGWLNSALILADKSGIHIGHYEESVGNIPDYGLNDLVIDRNFDRGYLELMHPTRPNPRRMLRLFRSAAYDRQSINSLHGISIKRFWELSIRLAQHCYHAGETADAESVIEISKAILRH
jgi:hypothetical protein